MQTQANLAGSNYYGITFVSGIPELVLLRIIGKICRWRDPSVEKQGGLFGWKELGLVD